MTGTRRTARTPSPLRKRAAPFRCRLIIMAKMPMAGRVKTRLAREAGVAAATRFARHALASTVAHLSRDWRWHTTLAVAPEGGAMPYPWPHAVARIGQGHGDLGRRMQRIMDAAGPGPLVIVGTDIPALRADHVRSAFRCLGTHDAVIGPAADGGYWLIGLRRRPRVLRLFAAVRWSSPHALADTLANLRGRSIGHVATLLDVDTAWDLALSGGAAGRRVPAPP
jgi:rSAM/selenodomain-associated transferase 1